MGRIREWWAERRGKDAPAVPTQTQPATDFGSNAARQQELYPAPVEVRDPCELLEPTVDPRYPIPADYRELSIDEERAIWYADGRRDAGTGIQTSKPIVKPDGTRGVQNIDPARTPNDWEPSLWAAMQWQHARNSVIAQEVSWFEEPFFELQRLAASGCHEKHARAHAKELGDEARHQGKQALAAIDKVFATLDARHKAEMMEEDVKMHRDLAKASRFGVEGRMAEVPELVKQV